MHPAWARSLRDQCKAAGVPFLFKQWGEHYTLTIADHPIKVTSMLIEGKTFTKWHDWNDGMVALRLGKKFTGRALDDSEHNGFPTL
jgi:hypothetical protein